MPITNAAQQPPAVEKPKHKLSELTTYELRDHRRELENAIAFYDENHPAAPIRAGLQAALDDVIAEQDDRKKLADA